jgi:hypothetical protein
MANRRNKEIEPLPFIRIGKKILYSRAAIGDYLARHSIGGAGTIKRSSDV